MKKKAAQIFYLDSSILLRYAIRHVNAIQNLEEYSDGAVTSVIAKVECMRVLDRWRLTREVSDRELSEARSRTFKLFEGVSLAEISESVIETASLTFPIAIKSLDAIHLATAIKLQQQFSLPVTMVTHDQKLALAAQALGMETVTS